MPEINLSSFGNYRQAESSVNATIALNSLKLNQVYKILPTTVSKATIKDLQKNLTTGSLNKTIIKINGNPEKFPFRHESGSFTLNGEMNNTSYNFTPKWSGFTNMNGIDYEYFPKLFYWDRTLWETALALDSGISKESLLYPKRLKLYQEIYIGHTPVTKIEQTVPMQKACVWNIDTGAAFKGPLTVLDVDSKEFWQSESLNELYFNERGRN